MTPSAGVLAYDPSKVGPGWIAFVLVVVLCIATFLLWRSMNTQLGRIKVPPRGSVADRSSRDRTNADDGVADGPAPDETEPPAT